MAAQPSSSQWELELLEAQQRRHLWSSLLCALGLRLRGWEGGSLVTEDFKHVQAVYDCESIGMVQRLLFTAMQRPAVDRRGMLPNLKMLISEAQIVRLGIRETRRRREAASIIEDCTPVQRRRQSELPALLSSSKRTRKGAQSCHMASNNLCIAAIPCSLLHLTSLIFVSGARPRTTYESESRGRRQPHAPAASAVISRCQHSPAMEAAGSRGAQTASQRRSHLAESEDEAAAI